MIFQYNEDLLQFIWQYQLYNPKGLKTEKGENITVIKQGQINFNSGPDFENAQIKIDKSIHFGSVEIHIDSKDWHTHKHQTDSAYDNVILHVCFSNSKMVSRKDGTSLPTLVLKDRINLDSLEKYNRLMTKKTFIPCENQLSSLSNFTINNWIDRMVVERLEDRCMLFQSYLETAKGNWNQAFYTAIIRSFGMPINSDFFEELALKLPYQLVQKHHLSLFQLEALFFGVANLLKEPDGDSYYQGLHNEYVFLSKKYGLKKVNHQLKFGRMRPMNLPHVKIAQIAALFHHVPQITNKVLSLPEVHEIKSLLAFDLSDYWKTHYSFHKISKERSKHISKKFVNHLFLNAFIPFVFFYEKTKLVGDTTKALDYLGSLSSESNSIIDKWKLTGISVNNALTSQALLHLYKTYCNSQRCLQCNIGKELLLQ
ncbi:MAG: hypothetical protein COA58_07695 [Bacteroidetes bacterium]|nr:MAG: hypothetical protein COA58_07695 [Bacteroidota bacterium]